jgi:hypothetical protein
MPPSTSDTQTAIDILKAENERLSGLVGTLTSERDKHKGDHETASKERDTLKAQVGNPDEHRKRADELEHKLRVVTHKAEFSKIAEDAGVHRDMIDDLFELSGYKPAKDEIDPKAFHDLIGDMKKSKPRYFADPAQQAAAAAAGHYDPKVQRTVPGSGRGASHDPSKAGITLTRAQMADPKFMLDKRNKEIIQSAVREGRVEQPKS